MCQHKAFLDLIVASGVEINCTATVSDFYRSKTCSTKLFGGVDTDGWGFLHIPLTYTHTVDDELEIYTTSMVVASHPEQGFICQGPVSREEMLYDMRGLVMLDNLKKLLVKDTLRFYKVRWNRGVPFNDPTNCIDIAMYNAKPVPAHWLTKVKNYLWDCYNKFNDEPHCA